MRVCRSPIGSIYPKSGRTTPSVEKRPHCGDRVGHVAFGTDWGREGIENGRKGQVFRGAGARMARGRGGADQILALDLAACDAVELVHLAGSGDSVWWRGEA